METHCITLETKITKEEKKNNKVSILFWDRALIGKQY